MGFSSKSTGFSMPNIKSSNKICFENTENMQTEYEEIDYSDEYASNYEMYYENYDIKVEENNLSEEESLGLLLENLISELDILNEEIKPIQEEYDTAMINVRNPIMFMQEFNDEQLRIAEEAHAKLTPLLVDKNTLETYIYQIEKELALAPFKDIYNTSECQDFLLNYHGEYSNFVNNVDEDYIRQLQSDYDTVMINVRNPVWFNPAFNTEQLNKARSLETELAVLENFLYINDEQRQTYIYLYETNPTKAEEFLNALQDRINQAKGAEAAALFINSLDLDDAGKLETSLANLFGVSKKGLADGIDTFFNGLENLVINNSSLTAEDYEKMIILQYLQENSFLFDETYEFSSSLGNMIPAMTVSAIITYLATPIAGSATASTLMGLSAGGNAKHRALVEGHGVLGSSLYGLLVGLSEGGLGFLLGKIPGISASSGLTLANLLSEGTEEFLQEYIDAGLQAVILKEDVDWSTIPENAVKSFIMGFFMSGLLNGGQAIVQITINGQRVNLKIEETLKYIKEHPGIDILEALKIVNPKINLRKSRFIAIGENFPGSIVPIKSTIEINGTTYYVNGSTSIVNGELAGVGAIKHILDKFTLTGEYNKVELQKLIDMVDRTKLSSSDLNKVIALENLLNQNQPLTIGKKKNNTMKKVQAFIDMIQNNDLDIDLSSINYKSLSITEEYRASMIGLLKQAEMDTNIDLLSNTDVLTLDEIEQLNLLQEEAKKIIYANALAQYDAGKICVPVEVVDASGNTVTRVEEVDVSGMDLTGLPIWVNASLDPNNPYYIEILTRPSHGNESGDITVAHMVYKGDVETVTVEQAAINQGNRAVEVIMKKMDFSSMTLDEAINAIKERAINDIIKPEGGLYIADSAAQQAAIDAINDRITSQDFIDELNKKLKKE